MYNGIIGIKGDDVLDTCDWDHDGRLFDAVAR